MKAATKTRTQRRMEKKQALILLVLVLAVSLASFTLGVIVGTRGAERDLALKQEAAEQVLAKVPSRPAPAAPAPAKPVEPAPETKPEATDEAAKLTFYDKLAKESNAPLGSGINLPPETETPPARAVPPIDLPAEPISKKELQQVSAAAPEEAAPAGLSSAGLPEVAPQGDYAVQVGSFAANADANKMKKRLLDKGYPAFVVEADLGQKGVWYRVRVGPYADRPAAEQVQALVAEREKIKGFVSRQ